VVDLRSICQGSFELLLRGKVHRQGCVAAPLSNHAQGGLPSLMTRRELQKGGEGKLCESAVLEDG
jgi:hypothetical protein